MNDETRALWEAVDQITKPTTRRLFRTDGEWLRELADDPAATVCDVAAYRAATVTHASVPSLWAQAEMALTTGADETGRGGSRLAERTPADLDLMEMMATVKDVVALQLQGRRIKARATVPEQCRQLAAHVAGHEPDHVEWWTFRFAQWARGLAHYLKAVDTGPKPVRLRNAACPLCKTRQVTIDTDLGPVVAPPLLVDFTGGFIRAAQCTACSGTWWRGDDLMQLADLLDTPETQQVAQ